MLQPTLLDCRMQHKTTSDADKCLCYSQHCLTASCSQTVLAIAQTLICIACSLMLHPAVKQCWLQHRHLSASLVVLCCILQSNCVGYSIDTYLHRLQSYVASCSQTVLAIAQTLICIVCSLMLHPAVKQCWLQHRHLSASFVVLCCILQSNSVGYSIDTYLHRLQSYVASCSQTVLAIAQTLICIVVVLCCILQSNSVGSQTYVHWLQHRHLSASFVVLCCILQSNSVGYSIDTYLHRLQSYVASCSQTVLAIAQTLICIACSLMLHPAVKQCWLQHRHLSASLVVLCCILQSNSVGYSIDTYLHRLQSYVASCSQTVLAIAQTLICIVCSLMLHPAVKQCWLQHRHLSASFVVLCCILQSNSVGYSIDTYLHRLQSYVASCSQTVLAIAQTLICIACSLMLHPAVKQCWLQHRHLSASLVVLCCILQSNSVGYSIDTYLHRLQSYVASCSQTVLAIAQTLICIVCSLMLHPAVKQCWLQHRHLSASLVVLCCILQSNCVGYSIDTYLHRLQSYVASCSQTVLAIAQTLICIACSLMLHPAVKQCWLQAIAVSCTLIIDTYLHRLQSYVASCSQTVLAIAQTLICIACSLMLHPAVKQCWLQHRHLSASFVVLCCILQSNSVGYSIDTYLHRLQSYVASCSQTVLAIAQTLICIACSLMLLQCWHRHLSASFVVLCCILQSNSVGYSIDTYLHRLQSYVASCSQTVLAIAQTLICIVCSLMLHPAVKQCWLQHRHLSASFVVLCCILQSNSVGYSIDTYLHRLQSYVASCSQTVLAIAQTLLCIACSLMLHPAVKLCWLQHRHLSASFVVLCCILQSNSVGYSIDTYLHRLQSYVASCSQTVLAIAQTLICIVCSLMLHPAVKLCWLQHRHLSASFVVLCCILQSNSVGYSIDTYLHRLQSYVASCSQTVLAIAQTLICIACSLMLHPASNSVGYSIDTYLHRLQSYVASCSQTVLAIAQTLICIVCSLMLHPAVKQCWLQHRHLSASLVVLCCILQSNSVGYSIDTYLHRCSLMLHLQSNSVGYSIDTYLHRLQSYVASCSQTVLAIAQTLICIVCSLMLHPAVKQCWLQHRHLSASLVVLCCILQSNSVGYSIDTLHRLQSYVASCSQTVLAIAQTLSASFVVLCCIVKQCWLQHRHLCIACSLMLHPAVKQCWLQHRHLSASLVVLCCINVVLCCILCWLQHRHLSASFVVLCCILQSNSVGYSIDTYLHRLQSYVASCSQTVLAIAQTLICIVCSLMLHPAVKQCWLQHRHLSASLVVLCCILQSNSVGYSIDTYLHRLQSYVASCSQTVLAIAQTLICIVCSLMLHPAVKQCWLQHRHLSASLVVLCCILQSNSVGTYLHRLQSYVASCIVLAIAQTLICIACSLMLHPAVKQCWLQHRHLSASLVVLCCILQSNSVGYSIDTYLHRLQSYVASCSQTVLAIAQTLICIACSLMLHPAVKQCWLQHRHLSASFVVLCCILQSNSVGYSIDTYLHRLQSYVASCSQTVLAIAQTLLCIACSLMLHPAVKQCWLQHRHLSASFVVLCCILQSNSVGYSIDTYLHRVIILQLLAIVTYVVSYVAAVKQCWLQHRHLSASLVVLCCILQSNSVGYSIDTYLHRLQSYVASCSQTVLAIAQTLICIVCSLMLHPAVKQCWLQHRHLSASFVVLCCILQSNSVGYSIDTYLHRLQSYVASCSQTVLAIAQTLICIVCSLMLHPAVKQCWLQHRHLSASLVVLCCILQSNSVGYSIDTYLHRLQSYVASCSQTVLAIAQTLICIACSLMLHPAVKQCWLQHRHLSASFVVLCCICSQTVLAIAQTLICIACSLMLHPAVKQCWLQHRHLSASFVVLCCILQSNSVGYSIDTYLHRLQSYVASCSQTVLAIAQTLICIACSLMLHPAVKQCWLQHRHLSASLVVLCCILQSNSVGYSIDTYLHRLQSYVASCSQTVLAIAQTLICIACSLMLHPAVKQCWLQHRHLSASLVVLCCILQSNSVGYSIDTYLHRLQSYVASCSQTVLAIAQTLICIACSLMLHPAVKQCWLQHRHLSASLVVLCCILQSNSVGYSIDTYLHRLCCILQSNCWLQHRHLSASFVVLCCILQSNSVGYSIDTYLHRLQSYVASCSQTVLAIAQTLICIVCSLMLHPAVKQCWLQHRHLSASLVVLCCILQSNSVGYSIDTYLHRLQSYVASCSQTVLAIAQTLICIACSLMLHHRHCSLNPAVKLCWLQHRHLSASFVVLCCILQSNSVGYSIDTYLHRLQSYVASCSQTVLAIAQTLICIACSLMLHPAVKQCWLQHRHLSASFVVLCCILQSNSVGYSIDTYLHRLQSYVASCSQTVLAIAQTLICIACSLMLHPAVKQCWLQHRHLSASLVVLCCILQSNSVGYSIDTYLHRLQSYVASNCSSNTYLHRLQSCVASCSQTVLAIAQTLICIVCSLMLHPAVKQCWLQHRHLSASFVVLCCILQSNSVGYSIDTYLHRLQSYVASCSQTVLAIAQTLICIACSLMLHPAVKQCWLQHRHLSAHLCCICIKLVQQTLMLYLVASCSQTVLAIAQTLICIACSLMLHPAVKQCWLQHRHLSASLVVLCCILQSNSVGYSIDTYLHRLQSYVASCSQTVLAIAQTLICIVCSLMLHPAVKQCWLQHRHLSASLVVLCCILQSNSVGYSIDTYLHRLQSYVASCSQTVLAIAQTLICIVCSLMLHPAVKQCWLQHRHLSASLVVLCCILQSNSVGYSIDTYLHRLQSYVASCSQTVLAIAQTLICIVCSLMLHPAVKQCWLQHRHLSASFVVLCCILQSNSVGYSIDTYLHRLQSYVASCSQTVLAIAQTLICIVCSLMLHPAVKQCWLQHRHLSASLVVLCCILQSNSVGYSIDTYLHRLQSYVASCSQTVLAIAQTLICIACSLMLHPAVKQCWLQHRHCCIACSLMLHPAVKLCWLQHRHLSASFVVLCCILQSNSVGYSIDTYLHRLQSYVASCSQTVLAIAQTLICIVVVLCCILQSNSVGYSIDTYLHRLQSYVASCSQTVLAIAQTLICIACSLMLHPAVKQCWLQHRHLSASFVVLCCILQSNSVGYSIDTYLHRLQSYVASCSQTVLAIAQTLICIACSLMLHPAVKQCWLQHRHLSASFVVLCCILQSNSVGYSIDTYLHRLQSYVASCSQTVLAIAQTLICIACSLMLHPAVKQCWLQHRHLSASFVVLCCILQSNSVGYSIDTYLHRLQSYVASCSQTVLAIAQTLICIVCSLMLHPAVKQCWLQHRHLSASLVVLCCILQSNSVGYSIDTYLHRLQSYVASCSQTVLAIAQTLLCIACSLMLHPAVKLCWLQHRHLSASFVVLCCILQSNSVGYSIDTYLHRLQSYVASCSQTVLAIAQTLICIACSLMLHPAVKQCWLQHRHLSASFVVLCCILQSNSVGYSIDTYSIDIICIVCSLMLHPAVKQCWLQHRHLSASFVVLCCILQSNSVGYSIDTYLHRLQSYVASCSQTVLAIAQTLICIAVLCCILQSNSVGYSIDTYLHRLQSYVASCSQTVLAIAQTLICIVCSLMLHPAVKQCWLQHRHLSASLVVLCCILQSNSVGYSIDTYLHRLQSYVASCSQTVLAIAQTHLSASFVVLCCICCILQSNSVGYSIDTYLHRLQSYVASCSQTVLAIAQTLICIACSLMLHPAVKQCWLQHRHLSASFVVLCCILQSNSVGYSIDTYLHRLQSYVASCSQTVLAIAQTLICIACSLMLHPAVKQCWLQHRHLSASFVVLCCILQSNSVGYSIDTYLHRLQSYVASCSQTVLAIAQTLICIACSLMLHPAVKLCWLQHRHLSASFVVLCCILQSNSVGYSIDTYLHRLQSYVASCSQTVLAIAQTLLCIVVVLCCILQSNSVGYSIDTYLHRLQSYVASCSQTVLAIAQTLICIACSLMLHPAVKQCWLQHRHLSASLVVLCCILQSNSVGYSIDTYLHRLQSYVASCSQTVLAIAQTLICIVCSLMLHPAVKQCWLQHRHLSASLVVLCCILQSNSVGYSIDTYLHRLQSYVASNSAQHRHSNLVVGQTVLAIAQTLICIVCSLMLHPAVKQCWLQHRHLSASLVVLCCILQSNCVGYSIDTYLHRLQSYVACGYSIAHLSASFVVLCCILQSNSVGYSIDTYLHRLQSYVASCSQTVLAIAQTLICIVCSLMLHPAVKQCWLQHRHLSASFVVLCCILQSNSVGYSIDTYLHRLQSYVASCSQTVLAIAQTLICIVCSLMLHPAVKQCWLQHRHLSASFVVLCCILQSNSVGYSIDTYLHRLQSYVASCSQTVLAIAQTLLCIACSLMLHRLQTMQISVYAIANNV